MPRNFAYLVIGSDTLDQAVRHDSIRAASLAFQRVAEDLDRFDQRVEGAIHLAPSRDAIVEYPDRVLSLGPRGGLRVEST